MFLLRAVRALRFRGAIEVALAVASVAVERERFPLRTVVGIIKLTAGPLLRNRRKRHWVSLRIPERVALRVYAKLSG
jgi:hypothetical protein